MSDDGPGAREVAYRPFAAEFDDASLSYSESDEERAPNYVVTPTGARINRLFAVGVLTEVERINDDTRRGRIVDPSGAFVTYAGQYQPEAQTFLERAETPSFVALTGKARTFEPEDSDRVFTSVRPESVSEVDADTRDRWIVAAAESTLERLAVLELARNSSLRGDDLREGLEAGGAPGPLAAGIPLALDHYDTSAAYVEAVRRMAVDALEVVAGERTEVRAHDITPDAGGDVAVGPLPETAVSIVEDAVSDSSGSSAPAVDSAASTDSGEPTDSVDSDGSIDDGSDMPAETSDRTAAETPAVSAEATTESDALGDFDATEPDVSEETADRSDSPAVEADSSLDDAADVDVGTAVSDADADDADSVDDEGMYEMDDDERDRIESEFGTEFSTGSEVDDPGEADIDVPEPDLDTSAESSATASASTTETGGLGDFDAGDATVEDPADVVDDLSETVSAEDSTEDADAGAIEADASAGVDLETAAVEAMEALDDGEGADRDAVIETVADEHGAAPDAVEDAIQDALMSGRCYEPGDGLLKAI
ncbi:hypothetical protein [Halorubrum vacuolatum]|uniref:Rpa-associated protein n=1 Tax=Halorubrum vacuolatum TaxID=63740 RepID=A0A238X9A0_HALVU|nr:hypothetical protein [Halorubrum vacuolatum]SNR55178.1 hypothetical protein SAMN06264855_11482 [Halorubrum vacuolatum]